MWWHAIFRAVIAAASYALGALRELYPAEWEAPLRLQATFGIGAVVVILVLLVEYRTGIRPARHVDRVRALVLKQLASKLLQNLREKGVQVRMNLMVPFRPVRWLFMRRFFRIIWSDGMDDQPDVNFQPPVRYLVVGECYRTKRPVLASRADLDKQKLGFWLRKHAPDSLDAVCSYPVYEPPAGNRQQSGKIVGVLNLDALRSRDQNAPGLLSSHNPPEVAALLDEKMRELARIAAQLVG